MSISFSGQGHPSPNAALASLRASRPELETEPLFSLWSSSKDEASATRERLLKMGRSELRLLALGQLLQASS
eukprot:CAMPEP_0206620850 /NCGR_PEP_ID=MMETSP0325_2-20121206/61879_1 /ASSEMBLY_ACC=CAM_ASM_000347 /TAXON_ID=2866 /ORGANISM="Crypthecodinium cohnii, Strain Seligo" /LENGTH=71 /DNA_ID=CAMNT_0054143909 /DNA_START=172 /DNA_END=387 /DNA_ORIENTATION=-